MLRAWVWRTLHTDCIRTISSANSMLKLWNGVAGWGSATGLMLTPKWFVRVRTHCKPVTLRLAGEKVHGWNTILTNNNKLIRVTAPYTRPPWKFLVAVSHRIPSTCYPANLQTTRLHCVRTPTFCSPRLSHQFHYIYRITILRIGQYNVTTDTLFR